MHDQHEANNRKPTYLPATANTTLHRVSEGDLEFVDPAEQKRYRGIVGQLLHMAAWSRPDICNAVREVTRHGHKSKKEHMAAAKKIATFIWQTPSRGWTLSPTRRWDGKDWSFQFKVRGRSDSNYANCTDTRKSVTGFIVYLEDAPVAIRSVMQKIIALSVTEAELIALVQCVQEMFFVRKILESMGLKVELPMLVECDNKGAVDLVNGHSIGGNTKHIAVRILHVRDYKDKGIIRVKWIPTELNEADISTKNSSRVVYEKHAPKYIGSLDRREG